MPDKTFSGPARSVGPLHGGTLAPFLAAIFGEQEPATMSDTPRPAGNLKTPAESIRAVPLVVQNGWIDRPAQTKGMSVLYVDQVQRMPSQGVQGQVRSAIGQSAYQPFMHYRAAHWLYAGWDPIYRFANTALDMRFAVSKAPALSNEQPGNLPGGVRMGPYAKPFRVAMQVPRFSTEPNTIIPRSQPGRPGR